MTQPPPQQPPAFGPWVEGELRLIGMLDNRMLGLLRAIEQTGSINQAAKRVGLSYKGAWQIIERANNLAPQALISTATGGSKGGGTRLTEAGNRLLKLFVKLEQQHRQFIDSLNQQLASDPEVMRLLKPLAIKTTASNQLSGRIAAVRLGSVNGEVLVELRGGETIAASLTLDEIEALKLQPGMDALLMINATEIIVAMEAQPDSFSARNVLPGKVIQLLEDEVNAEVVIGLQGNVSIAAMMTKAGARQLQLCQGIAAFALFKSNAVILGVLAEAQ